MPEISRFFGITILMFFGDHDPPHFHVFYSGMEAKVSIKSREVIQGEISARALKLIKEWIELHEKELLDNFEKIKNRREDWKKIEPLT